MRPTLTVPGHRKHLVALAMLAAVSATGLPVHGQVTVDVTGQVGANYGLSTDNQGNTVYSFGGAFATLQAEAGIPIEMTVSAVPSAQAQYWTAPSTWGVAGYLMFTQYVGSYADTIAGILQLNPVSILDIPSQYNTLADLGPTERSISIPGFELRSTILPGILDSNLTASASLKYNVFLPTGANILMDQSNVTIQSLTLQSGAILTGNGNFTVRTDLINQGTLYNLGGIIQGNFNNSGPYVDITGPLSVQGTFTNYGTIAVESGGSLTLAQVSSNGGEIDLYGGSITAPGTFTNNGSFKWYSGSIPNLANTISGNVAISGTDQKFIGRGITMTNSGAIRQVGNSTVTMDGFVLVSGDYSSILNNLPGATYDIQGDGSIKPWAPDFQPQLSETINNAGLFKKSGGTGTSQIGDSSYLTFNNTGTVEVDSGTLSLQGKATNSNGAFTFANGGMLQVACGMTLSGLTTLTGTGTFEIPSGGTVATPSGQNATINAASGTTLLLDGGNLCLKPDASTSGTVTLSGSGNFQWTGGNIGGYQGTVAIASDAGFTISGTNQKFIGRGATLTNSGSIKQVGNSTVTMDGFVLISGDYSSILNNLAGATYDIQGDGNIKPWAPDFQPQLSEKINNAGLFKKSGGSGISQIGDSSYLSFNNSGTVEVDSGTLSFQGSFTQSSGITNLKGGNIAFNGAGQFQGGTLTGSGTITGSVSNTGALVSPGHSPGTIVIDGNYTQGSSGILLIELAGTGAGQFDVLDVNGTASLGGILEVSFLNGYSPAIGDQFYILDFNSRSGNFSSIQVLGEPGFQFTSSFDSSGMTLVTTAVGVPEPASLALLALGGLALLRHRRRGGV